MNMIGWYGILGRGNYDHLHLADDKAETQRCRDWLKIIMPVRTMQPSLAFASLTAVNSCNVSACLRMSSVHTLSAFIHLPPRGAWHRRLLDYCHLSSGFKANSQAPVSYSQYFCNIYLNMTRSRPLQRDWVGSNQNLTKETLIHAGLADLSVKVQG